MRNERAEQLKLARAEIKAGLCAPVEIARLRCANIYRTADLVAAQAEIERLRGLLRLLLSNRLYAQPAPTPQKSCKFCFSEWEKQEKEWHLEQCPVALGLAALAEKP